MTGSLFVVATPIGNLDDLSPRARATLAACDRVAAEDTRHSGRLLKHCGIDRPLVSLHEHNEERATAELLRRLEAGERIALISDAGTPLISDPGYRLVREARARDIAVIPIPGPSALVAALSVAGLPTDAFRFAGFLPARAKARRDALAALAGTAATLVFYESSHRIGAMLTDCAGELGGGRPAFIGREMTKLHEQYRAGLLEELARAVDAGEIPARGEFVVLVAGSTEPRGVDTEQAAALIRVLIAELAPAQAARLTAAYTGLPRRDCYALAQQLKRAED